MRVSFLLVSLFIVSFYSVHAAEKNLSQPIKIVPKVIYGTDDRFDVFESSDSLMKELSRSTVALIENSDLVQDGDNYIIKSPTLSEEGVCKSERFSNQLAAASCSGFLVAPDTVVTAGHCINSVSECEEFSFVFDFANTDEVKSSFTFNKSQVFHCTQIIARERSSIDMNDYAVLKLDRPVMDRTPFTIRQVGKPADDAVLTVIGHPSGLPLKITTAAEMRNNSNPIFFTTNSDTYGGNSGSVVVDSRTGIVEGILVRGDLDYKQSPTESCDISVHRDQNGGRGEDVTRITNIKVLQKN